MFYLNIPWKLTTNAPIAPIAVVPLAVVSIAIAVVAVAIAAIVPTAP